MEISLVIPAYNEEPYIAATLESALKNSHGKFKEIVVVDNGSKDKTKEIAQSFPGVRVIYEPRKGTGNARQSGFEVTTSEIVAYVDADTRIPEGWVEKIEQAFKDPNVVFLSGPFRYYESKSYPLWLLNGLWWVTPPFAWTIGYMGNTGNCAIRSDALREVGGHDRSIAFYGDDTDLARRLHRVGKTLWRITFNDYTSARRFDEIGLIKTLAFYLINYWWPIMFHRPFTPGSQDLKTQSAVHEEQLTHS